MPMLFLALLASVLAGCSAACGNEIIEVKHAPDGADRAILFQRNCGATTGPNLQVSILGPDEELEGPGNLFVADDDHGAAVGPDPIVQLFWQPDGRLVVLHHPRARIFKQEDGANGVRVSYEKQPS